MVWWESNGVLGLLQGYSGDTIFNHHHFNFLAFLVIFSLVGLGLEKQLASCEF
jgi:hypothetical protein